MGEGTLGLKFLADSECPCLFSYPCCLSTALLASLSLSATSSGKRIPRGKWSQMLAHLSVFSLPDLVPKILHCFVNCLVPSDIFNIFFFSSYSQEKDWLLFYVCRKIACKNNPNSPPLLLHTHRQTLFIAGAQRTIPQSMVLYMLSTS